MSYLLAKRNDEVLDDREADALFALLERQLPAGSAERAGEAAGAKR